MDWIQDLFERVQLLALASTRIAAAFLIMPLFAPEVVPPLVRNSILIGLGVIVLAAQPDAAVPVSTTLFDWVGLYAKEAFIGLTIGLFFSTILWAFQTAGEIIDAKSGATIAQIIDPLTGSPTSLTGAFLGQLANFLFMSVGGFFLLVAALFQSYALWPPQSPVPDLRAGGVALFEGEFARLMTLSVLLCAPALVVLFVVDLGLGLINRFAQQLNVFALSLSIKTWLATAIVLITLSGLIGRLTQDIAERPGVVRTVLERLFQ
jgi:type III secretion protein T